MHTYYCFDGICDLINSLKMGRKSIILMGKGMFSSLDDVGDLSLFFGGYRIHMYSCFDGGGDILLFWWACGQGKDESLF